MKNKILFTVLIFLVVSCSTTKKITNQRSNWIRDYAFCSCFEYTINETIKKEIRRIDFSRAMLFDIADLSEIYKSIDSLALKQSKKIQPTQIEDYENKRPIIAKCLEFSRSKEIDSLIEKHKP